jgi:hypothetical protein
MIGFNKEVWDKVKKQFLEAYALKCSAKALCICFQDLQQRYDENVQTFYNSVSETFLNAYTSKPDHTTTYMGTLHSNATQNQCDEIMLQGVNRMQLLMLNTVFLEGL